MRSIARPAYGDFPHNRVNKRLGTGEASSISGTTKVGAATHPLAALKDLGGCRGSITPVQSSPLRILKVAQPTEAGVANVVLALVEHEVKLGWDVHLACPTTSGYLAERAAALGATVHKWEARRSPLAGLLSEAGRLRKIVTEVRPDIVHLHSAKAGLVGRLVLRGTIPTIFQPHAWSFQAVTGTMRVATLGWERVAAHRTDLTLCVSTDERSVGAQSRCLSPRVVVVPNGVDVDRFAPTCRQDARNGLHIDLQGPLVVCIGRLATQKGQDVLLRAWTEVVRRVPDAHLILVGDGPTGPSLRAMNAPQTLFVGDQRDVRPWISASDLVVSPSRWEGSSLVMLEAMALGRAVVTTDVAGVREAFGERDVIAPIDDADELTRLIVERLQDPTLRNEEERANRQLVEERFDLRRSCDRTAEAILDLLEATA